MKELLSENSTRLIGCIIFLILAIVDNHETNKFLEKRLDVTEYRDHHASVALLYAVILILLTVIFFPASPD